MGREGERTYVASWVFQLVSLTRGCLSDGCVASWDESTTTTSTSPFTDGDLHNACAPASHVTTCAIYRDANPSKLGLVMMTRLNIGASAQ